MPNPIDRHLTEEEFERLSRSQPVVDDASPRPSDSDQLLLQHLSDCADCRRELDSMVATKKRLASLRVTTPQAPADTCPSTEEWMKWATGLMNESRSQEMLEHATACDCCGPLLCATTENLTSETTQEENILLESLDCNRPEWQKRMARRLSGVSESVELSPRPANQWWKAISFRLRLALTTALAFITLSSTVWYLKSRTETTTDHLLAEAYAQQRTIELRIPEAKHAPLREERGATRSSLAKPGALLKAEFEIKEQLAAKPDDPALLGAKGRAEILEWEYDEAIRSLRRALDLDQGSPNLLCDLATAYVQRGDSENRPLDYGQAIEYLGQILQKDPANKLALFNRAIVEERLQLVEQATRDWQKYLQIDPDGDWSNEARQRLQALQEKTKSGLEFPHSERDPALAAHTLELHQADASPNPRSWPASLDEDYLDIALTRWLPDLASTPPQDSVHSAEWKALSVLATSLSLRHRDEWLVRVLATPRTHHVLDGWKQLARAIRYNASGEFDVAARSAAEAENLLRQESSPAHLRALWERAYALQRLQRGSECTALTETEVNAGEWQPYPWIHTQLMLEHSICSAMVGRMRDTRSEVQTAISLAQSSGYETLLLRALHIMGIQAASQDPEVAWRFFARGLTLHWAGAYRPFRAYQFYAEMSFIPEARGHWQLARTLMQEAVTHIDRSPNRLMQAVAHQSLAVDNQLAGDDEGALAQFREAARIFSSLPPNASRDALLFTALVYQASLLSEESRSVEALEAIRKAKQISPPETQYWVWLHFYQALGETQLRLGHTDDAERALRSAVYISESALANIANENDRLFWERHSARAYKALVQLEFENKHDPRAGLKTWQWYAAAPIRIPDQKAPQTAINFAEIEDATVPMPSYLDDALPGLADATVLSVAQINGGYLAWLYDDRGVSSAEISVAPDHVQREVRRLLRLCSDPSSDPADIRKSGRMLFDWFLAPFASQLDPSRILVFEPDGALHDAPFAVFVTPEGQFLAQKFVLGISPGLGYAKRLRKSARFSSRDSVLAIAIPSGTARARELHLPSLPDSEAEAREIASYFAQRYLLVGNEASASTIQRDLPTVRVLHFAGHALTTSTRSGLLLSASGPARQENEEGATLLDADRLSMLPLHTLDLAVLSACATSDQDYDLGSPRGLVETFFRAGVPQVVATQWDIDSRSARQLIGGFYGNLVQGERPVQALSAAAKAVRSRDETSHPYYWASFMVFGTGWN